MGEFSAHMCMCVCTHVVCMVSLQRMLTLYHKSVRSTSLPGFMRPTDVLHCLIACATSCARLHLREQVKANPDCVVRPTLHHHK